MERELKVGAIGTLAIGLAAGVDEKRYPGGGMGAFRDVFGIIVRITAFVPNGYCVQFKSAPRISVGK